MTASERLQLEPDGRMPSNRVNHRRRARSRASGLLAPNWAVYGGGCPVVPLCPRPRSAHYDDFDVLVTEASPSLRARARNCARMPQPLRVLERARPPEQVGRAGHRERLAQGVPRPAGASMTVPSRRVRRRGRCRRGGDRLRQGRKRASRHNSRARPQRQVLDALKSTPYSRYPGEIVDKIKVYGRMPGVEDRLCERVRLGGRQPQLRGARQRRLQVHEQQRPEDQAPPPRSGRSAPAERTASTTSHWQNGVDERRDKDDQVHRRDRPLPRLRPRPYEHLRPLPAPPGRPR